MLSCVLVYKLTLHNNKIKEIEHVNVYCLALYRLLTRVMAKEIDFFHCCLMEVKKWDQKNEINSISTSIIYMWQKYTTWY